MGPFQLKILSPDRYTPSPGPANFGLEFKDSHTVDDETPKIKLSVIMHVMCR